VQLFFFFLSIGGGCRVPDEEEGGGVESRSLLSSVDASGTKAFGANAFGVGGGGGMNAAIAGCLVPEEEG
jgi:hypothetical protein